MRTGARSSRRQAATISAAIGLACALLPWFGRAVPALDPPSAILPVALIAALAALAIDRSRLPAGLAASLAILLVAISVAQPVWPLRTMPTSGRRVVIITHNVATANSDPESTVATLLKSGADILLLQESDGTMVPMLARLRARFPYGSRCDTPCSMAILSRWPTSRVRYRFRDDAMRPFGPSLLQTMVTIPGLPTFPVVTLHLSRRLSEADAAAGQAALAAAIRYRRDPGMLLGGDFNATPWSATIRRLDDGLRPLRRITRATFSWPARTGRHAFPFPLAPIDHVYAGPRWTPVAVTRLPRTGSDHYGIRAELIWRG